MVGDVQLRSGMRRFFAQDQPGPGGQADRSTRALTLATQAPRGV